MRELLLLGSFEKLLASISSNPCLIRIYFVTLLEATFSILSTLPLMLLATMLLHSSLRLYHLATASKCCITYALETVLFDGKLQEWQCIHIGKTDIFYLPGKVREYINISKNGLFAWCINTFMMNVQMREDLLWWNRKSTFFTNDAFGCNIVNKDLLEFIHINSCFVS